MKQILVTGANGFVGHHLVRELVANGYKVVSTGRGEAPTLDGIVERHYDMDLTYAEVVERIDFSTIDGVIHLAGLAAVGPSFDSPQQYVEVNMGMEINLFETALEQGVKPRFIVISSASLYDPKGPLPVTETSPVMPNSPYAVSKLGQEQLGLYYKSRGFDVIIARPFNHVGPGQGLGFIVPDLTKQVFDVEKGTATQVLVGNLDAERDYTDVRDVCRAYRLLFEKGKSGETYNICTGKSLSGKDILDLILETSASKPSITQDPARMRPSDTPVIYGDNSKIKADTGWQPEVAISQTIKDVVNDWRSR